MPLPDSDKRLESLYGCGAGADVGGVASNCEVVEHQKVQMGKEGRKRDDGREGKESKDEGDSALLHSQLIFRP